MATIPVRAVAKPLTWPPKDIPPFPAVALKALSLMAGTDTSLIELCNLIRPDAAFSSEVLRFANSPLVSFSKNITSVLQASMLLGFRRLRSVVITVGLRSYLAEPLSPVLASCWRHSVASAIIAERAAKACLLDKDSAYTGAVLHDIGRVAMAVTMPQAYSRVIERGADLPADLLQTERGLCGINHCQAGGDLVKAWGLPEAFSTVTMCHHNSGTHSTDSASIVPRSCLLADSLGFSVVAFRKLGTYSEVLGDFVEAARRAFPASEQELAADINRQIGLIESL